MSAVRGLRPRRAAGLVALALLLAGSAALGAAAPAARGDSAARATAPKRPPSVRDSPGWYPVADPESASVRIGRRLNAPLVATPFRGGTRTLDDLGRAVCRLVSRGDRDSLMALCVTDTEFRDILWREFPQSRPVTGLQWEDGWRVLSMRLQSGCSDAVGQLGGRRWEFVRFERSDSTMRYRNFSLHNGLVLVARDEHGGLERWGWLRSAAERKGRFKIYSVRD